MLSSKWAEQFHPGLSLPEGKPFMREASLVLSDSGSKGSVGSRLAGHTVCPSTLSQGRKARAAPPLSACRLGCALLMMVSAGRPPSLRTLGALFPGWSSVLSCRPEEFTEHRVPVALHRQKPPGSPVQSRASQSSCNPPKKFINPISQMRRWRPRKVELVQPLACTAKQSLGVPICEGGVGAAVNGWLRACHLSGISHWGSPNHHAGPPHSGY